jgi:hypothetical protein
MTFATMEVCLERVAYRVQPISVSPGEENHEEDVVVKQQYCAAVRKQVQLVETRVYPKTISCRWTSTA